ncbi:MAG: hypothetical protein EPN93_20295 [Spirochaetes bacterium]|nr:MAG: hypothetical protein EPN93_20295 [Spirochaetota bacterium]
MSHSHNMCSSETKGIDQIHCVSCGRELDYVSATVSGEAADAIYICMGSIKQKIFVYGKYVGGRYGAISFGKYFTREQCAEKACDESIAEMLRTMSEEEYSRFITCHKGVMEAIVLTKSKVEMRKKDLVGGALDSVLPRFSDERKYFCHEHAGATGFRCSCGEPLIDIGSDLYRDLTGMEDRKFIEVYLPGILELK